MRCTYIESKLVTEQMQGVRTRIKVSKEREKV